MAAHTAIAPPSEMARLKDEILMRVKYMRALRVTPHFENRVFYDVRWGSFLKHGGTALLKEVSR